MRCGKRAVGIMNARKSLVLVLTPPNGTSLRLPAYPRMPCASVWLTDANGPLYQTIAWAEVAVPLARLRVDAVPAVARD